MKQKIPVKYRLSVGFTIFASFFGAGNLIFPPHLGLVSGPAWVWAFLSYILMDAGLGILTILAVSRCEDGFEGLMRKLGVLGSVLILLDAMCLGPVACVPRTAAVTFELAIHPVAPGVSSWVVSLVYFVMTALLCIRPSKIVDIVGSFMTPVLLAGLLFLIGKGIITAPAPYSAGMGAAEAFREGLLAGYQTMDMLVASLLSAVLIVSVAEHRIERPDSTRLFASASVVAAVGLFVVYGGLTYLGAVSGLDVSLSNADVLLGVVKEVLGSGGLYLLLVIVTLACLTTAIGLVSACAQAVCTLLKERVPYPVMVVIMCVVSFVISNLGIDSILAIASPVLALIYPAVISVVVLSFLPEKVFNPTVCRWAVCCSLVFAVWSLADGLMAADLGASRLPLASVDLAWLLPTAVCAVIGYFLSRRRSAVSA